MSGSGFGRLSRYRDDSSSVASGPSNIPLSELPPSPSSGSPSDNLLREDARSHGRLDFDDDEVPEPPLFRGPPPPISQSVLLPGRHKPKSSSSASKVLRDGLSTIKSVVFDPEPTTYEPRPIHGDTVWRNLVRREHDIETDLQRLLDIQALGLHSGTEPPVPMGASADDDEVRSAGSTTPTATWYSSRSHMIASINPITRSTATGEVIPVRQPRNQRGPRGLHAARNGIAHSIASLAMLKVEEDGHVMGALAQRKTALSRLTTLAAKKDHITEELDAVVADGEEPISAEILLVEKQRAEVDGRIAQMEKTLEQLRLRSRQLTDAHEELCSRREAGLSGFKGALRQVDKELGGMVKSPPVDPLDPELLRQARGSDAVSKGIDVLRTPPSRRTADMVMSWWQHEIAVLEEKQEAVRTEKQALDEGARLWNDVVKRVATFEQELKKDIEQVLSEGRDPEEASRRQLGRMPEVAQYLEECMVLSRQNGWTLLICAIGAELEAFQKAQDSLTDSLGERRRERSDSQNSNEVPPDLLESRPAVQQHQRHQRQHSRQQQPQQYQQPSLARSDSEDSNSVPPDLLTTQDKSPRRARVDDEDEVPASLLMERDHLDVV